MRNFLWVLALGIIVAYGFFWALGAFAFDEVLWLSLVVVALVILWVIHVVLQRRQAPTLHRDSRLVSARERRGF
jgi:heme exporter protein D